jgi:hypothetical protein
VTPYGIESECKITIILIVGSSNSYLASLGLRQRETDQWFLANIIVQPSNISAVFLKVTKILTKHTQKILQTAQCARGVYMCSTELYLYNMVQS